MTLTNTTEYRVSARGFNAVKKICSKITNQDSRRRAFKALLCMDALADYLYSQGFDIDISKNLYKIMPLNEEFEFTDIHCNGRFINVVPVVNGQYVLIPKNHIIFDVVPELYVVADYNQTTKKVKFLGCFEGNKIPKNVENGKYYVCDIRNIQPPAIIDELLSSVKNVELSENSHGIFVSFFIDYLDGVLDDTSKKRLITHLIECKDCRSELVEFFDYEAIAKETKKYPEVFSDNTLDIVGAVAVNDPKYKDFKEYTVSIEKQKDEYEEDEEEDGDGKQIKSAIEDPLQILYGKDKNKKIFDLMGDRPKKSSSMLDSVMSDISKEAKKIQNTEQITTEEMTVSYSGAINPEYYAENLPEGTDIDEPIQSDTLHLDIDNIPMPTPKFSAKEEVLQTTPITPTEENFVAEEGDNIYEIVEENDDEVLENTDAKDEDVFEFVENTEEEPKNAETTAIPYSLKTDVDKPEFSSRLKAQDKSTLTASDEILLLDDEQNVDTPEFINNMSQKQTEKQIEEENDYISIEDDDSSLFDILKSQSDENELPTSMDSVEYYENIDNETPNTAVDEMEIQISNEKIDDDVIEILDDFKDFSHLNINPPIENEKDANKMPSSKNTSLSIELSPFEGEETLIDDDIQKQEKSFDNTGDDLVVSDDLPQKNIVNVNEKDILLNDDVEEIQEYELIHFDAVDIDIVDEKDMQNLNSVIPSTIDEAGIAASSLIDDYEDSKKESNSLNDTKLFAPPMNDDTLTSAIDNHLLSDNSVEGTVLANDLLFSSNEENMGIALPQNTNSVTSKLTNDDLEDDLVIIDEDEETNNIQAVSVPLPTEEDDLVIINDDEEDNTFITPFGTNDNTNSVASKLTDDDLEDDLVIIDEDEETNNVQAVSVPLPTEDDDFVIINDDEEDNTFITPLVTSNDTNSVTSKLTEDDLEDDLVIIGENKDNLLTDIQDNSQEDFSKTENVEIAKEELENELNINTDDIDDDLLLGLPTIEKEEKSVSVEKESSAQNQLDDTDFIEFESEDNSDLLSFDDSQDFLLSDDDDNSLLMDEEEDENTLVEPINETISSDIPYEKDDLVIIDENSEPQALSTDTEDDDDLIVIDDDETFINSTTDAIAAVGTEKPQSVSDMEDYDNSTNFFRPAGASFDDDLVVIQDENTDIPLIEEENTNSVDDLITIDDEDIQLDDTLLTEPETTQDKTEEQENASEEIVEEKETTSDSQQAKKPVSQLDLIFNSLSSREREQIDAVQSGEAMEETPLIKEETVKIPQPQNTSKPVFRNIKDAISAKEEAVEDGRISLSESTEPVIDPLINTTVEKINEDDFEYEEVQVEEKNETPKEHIKQEEETVEEEVEYVYEDENGEEYIPEEGEEVEYVYEDEDGNIISDEELIEEEIGDISDDATEAEPSGSIVYQEDKNPLKSTEYTEEELSFDKKSEDDITSQDFDDIDDEISDFDEDVNNDNANSQDFENGEESEEDVEEENLEGEANAVQDNKKAIIKKTAIAAAVLLVLAGAGIAAKMFLSNTNAQAGQQALNEGIAIGENVPNEEEGGLSVPDENSESLAGSPTAVSPVIGGEEDEEGGLSIPESDNEAVLGGEAPKSSPIQEPVGPKAGTANTTTSDMNKAVANAFSESPSSFSVNKVSWGVGATLAADSDFKAYLQKMGKTIKSGLRKNLASVKGEAPANPVKVQIKYSDTGVLQDTVIIKSCGKPEIDEVVLQSVKQTAEACPFPELSENTLKANQKATGSNTVKMSLTVTF